MYLSCLGYANCYFLLVVCRPILDSFAVIFFAGAVMFHNSSQRKYWIFKSEDELEHLRRKANQKFRHKLVESGKVRGA